MKDIMIDLETLGTRHDAMVISIGACYFDRRTGEIGRAFSANINPKENGDRFTMDYDTVKWWTEQSESARKLVFETPTYLEIALFELMKFIGDGNEVTLWSHATFDMPILSHAFEVANLKNPVPYRNMRDLRTLMDLADHHSKTAREGTHHHALDDAKFQAKYAAEAFRKMSCDHPSWESGVCCECGKVYGR